MMVGWLKCARHQHSIKRKIFTTKLIWSIFSQVCGILDPLLEEHFPVSSGVRIIAEPGRYYSASAFTLVVNVLARRTVKGSQLKQDEKSVEAAGHKDFDKQVSCCHEKELHLWYAFCNFMKHTFVALDKLKIFFGFVCYLFICNLCPFCQGFMYYVNDGVYGSFNCLVFDHATVTPEVFGTDERAEKFPSSIWGPTCDSLDCITKNVLLPKVCYSYTFNSRVPSSIFSEITFWCCPSVNWLVTKI